MIGDFIANNGSFISTVEYDAVHHGNLFTKINYKFDEDKILQELKAYIDATYTQHYSGRYQATDMILDAGHGDGFCIGSIMKYAKRYGKKEGYNRKDLLKIIHYAIIALHNHNLEHSKQKEGE